ncbi:MAG: hypothetical protein M3124_02480 [Actinomycetota bacterium]|nr:hypothetical protein [Actinomycetota bacterium]
MSTARIPGSPAHAVAQILGVFPAEWRTVHGQVIGRRGHVIDHVVVGPPGVFCLTARRQRGGVTVTERDCLVDGRSVDLFAGARREATAVSNRLKIATGLESAVLPVVVLVGARLTVERQPEGLMVVTDDALALWLKSLRATLNGTDRRTLAEAIETPATWLAPRKRRSHLRLATPTTKRPSTTGSGDRFALYETWARTGLHRFYVHDPDGKCLAYYDVVAKELVIANEGARDFATAMLGPYMKDSPAVRIDAIITRSHRP